MTPPSALQCYQGCPSNFATHLWMPGGTPDPLSEHRDGLIGAPMSRVDGPLKVQGAARFAAEFPMEGLVYAALVHSTVPKGRIATLDVSAATGSPGVVLVMTHENAPRMKPMPLFMTKNKAAGGDDLPVMQDDRVHWNGQPVAMVLAETQEQADHAKSFIRITYDAEPATTSFAAAKAQRTKPGTFQGEPLKHETGDAEAALARSPFRIGATYSTPRHNHNAIELHAATVAWKGNELVIHDASPAVAHMAWSMAEVFGLDEKQVHVTSPFVGGGFGGKTLWQHQVLAAAASGLAGRPVRIMLSREGVYPRSRRPNQHRTTRGDRRPGRRALRRADPHRVRRHDGAQQHARAVRPAGSLRLCGREHQARCRSGDARHAGQHVHARSWRSRRHLRPGERHRRVGQPHENGSDRVAHPQRAGQGSDRRAFVEAYRSGAERFGWSRRSATPGAHHEGEWRVGLGCATATYPYYRMPGGAARIILTKDGHVTVEVAAHEMGMGTATAQTQVTAARLGLPVERVRFCHGDSRFPGLVLAGGSQQTASIGSAVMAAQQIVMGLGLALMDETQFDERNGRIMNPSPLRVPRPRSHGRARNRRDVDRHPRSAFADGRARAGRNRDHRRRSGRRERRLLRLRPTCARIADHARQAARMSAEFRCEEDGMFSYPAAAARTGF